MRTNRLRSARSTSAIADVTQLGEYDSKFAEYLDGLRSAKAVIEDVSATARDFRSSLEFSPERLDEIEDRLAEISRLSRKYGGTVEVALEHLKDAEERLENIESAEEREAELRAKIKRLRGEYLDAAGKLHDARAKAAVKFAKDVERELAGVALEKAKFEVAIGKAAVDGESVTGFTSRGIDSIEFLFSANVGESPKPLAKVASGGEASRLMLILKTVVRSRDQQRTSVFDEIDAGIGGRVAETVGLKLRSLAQDQQILCVTHQAQVASKADRHFVVEKRTEKKATVVTVRELDEKQRVEEVARMLAGENVSDAARENARELLAAAH